MLASLGTGVLMGVVAGLTRIWVPVAFLLVGVGLSGGIGDMIAPAFSLVSDSETGQTAAGFLLVFMVIMLAGAFITLALLVPLTVLSTLVPLIPMGSLINRAGGALLGLLLGVVFISVVLIGLQQIPVEAVGRALGESAFASGPIGWVDRFVASIEISKDWKNFD